MESVPGWRAIDLARHYGSKNASITRTRFALLVSPPRQGRDGIFSFLFASFSVETKSMKPH